MAKTLTGVIGGGDKKGRYRETKVTTGGSTVPFAKASSTSARSRQTGERSGINKDTIQGTNRKKALKSRPNTVGY